MRLPSLLILVSLFAAPLSAAQPAAKADAPKAQKLVQVSTLNTIEANREFQANVQLLQAQRQAAVELNTAIEREKDAAKQKELKGRLDALMAKLNENNTLMRKTYGFSLDRNYSVVIEKAHVYMFVTEEEAAQLEQAAKKK
ncbi:MAG: hypothetical protein RLZZ447_495 [Verrucomicrobiota bacterium]|jgi:hypothetical protein